MGKVPLISPVIDSSVSPFWIYNQEAEPALGVGVTGDCPGRPGQGGGGGLVQLGEAWCSSGITIKGAKGDDC